MIPKNLMQKLTKADAKVLAVACALKAGIANGKNSISGVIVHDAGRPWLSLTVASGVSAVAKMEEYAGAASESLGRDRVCRYCGCSESHPCPGGCSWLKGAGNCCTDPRCVTRYMTARPKRARARKPGRTARK